MLAGHAPPAVLAETTDLETLREATAAGRLWVAIDGSEVVGYARARLLAPDLPHLEEIDVLPSHGRRGIGASLVRTVCDWARRSGHAQLTLTTFRGLPFNMPFYARMGFAEVPADELREELLRTVAEEAARGLDPPRRVVMRYRTR